MHILHPFLEQKSLNQMVNTFIRYYSPRKKTFIPQFGQGSGDTPLGLQRGSKRKRSLEDSHGLGEMESRQNTGHNPSPMIARSVENAIVLLVIALGAICAWRAEIPGPIQDPLPRHPGSAFSLSGLSPTPPFHSPTDNSFPTLVENKRRLSGISHPVGACNSNDSLDQPPRNMDFIPGMAYYAYATDILGNLQGGNELSHAQACLLAALYAGQLAHPFSSHGWISQASRACQFLVRP